MKKLCLCQTLLLGITMFFQTAIAEPLDCRVIGVLDGDTIDCLRNKSTYRIRLNHIDAPEKAQPFGKASKKNLSDLIYGKQVKIVISGQDRYRRNIGVIYLHGKNINAQQVKDGMAWAYVKYATPEYIKWEIEARNKKAGLWVDPYPIYPSDFRKARRHRH